MKLFSTIYIFIILFSGCTVLSAQDTDTISKQDLNRITGSWKGSLTYLDYSTGKPYTMPADVNVTQIGESNQFIFSRTYPDEPGANSADTVTISDNGKYFDDETVISRKLLHGGSIEIVTEVDGTDGNDNKPATIRHIYMLGNNAFIIIKEVQFKGETEWIQRHEYNYTK